MRKSAARLALRYRAACIRPQRRRYGAHTPSKRIERGHELTGRADTSQIGRFLGATGRECSRQRRARRFKAYNRRFYSWHRNAGWGATEISRLRVLGALVQPKHSHRPEPFGLHASVGAVQGASACWLGYRADPPYRRDSLA